MFSFPDSSSTIGDFIKFLVTGHVTLDYRAFSHDVTAAILMIQNNETTAMLVY